MNKRKMSDLQTGDRFYFNEFGIEWIKVDPRPFLYESDGEYYIVSEQGEIARIYEDNDILTSW